MGGNHREVVLRYFPSETAATTGGRFTPPAWNGTVREGASVRTCSTGNSKSCRWNVHVAAAEDPTARAWPRDAIVASGAAVRTTALPGIVRPILTTCVAYWMTGSARHRRPHRRSRHQHTPTVCGTGSPTPRRSSTRNPRCASVAKSTSCYGSFRPPGRYDADPGRPSDTRNHLEGELAADVYNQLCFDVIEYVKRPGVHPHRPCV